MNSFFKLLEKKEKSIRDVLGVISRWEAKEPKKKWSEYRRNSGVVDTIWLHIQKTFYGKSK